MSSPSLGRLVKFKDLTQMQISSKITGCLLSVCLWGQIWENGEAWADPGSLAGVGARSSPDWLTQGTIYEVFPRDFSQEGNLKQVTARLPELQNLGVNILWVMPIHPIGLKGRKGTYGSPYSIRDYYAVNPDYGSLADFQDLVTKAHERGMKVIMDLVANHTSWDSVMMKHPEYYKQDGSGHIIPPDPGWTDVAGLNYQNQDLRRYMIHMMEYWIKTADVDGFRCDVAYAVPTDFWEEARKNLEAIKPDIMMLAEASKPELLTNAFNLDYSWPILHSLDNVILRGAPASDLRSTWTENKALFPAGALHMMISDDHDEARAVSRYGINGALAASILMFTMDGVPLVYNGMEAGDATESGDPALFYKLPIFWHPRERPDSRAIYHDLIEWRKQYPALSSGQTTWLTNTDPDDVVSYMRHDDKDEFVIEINFSSRPVDGTVELEGVGDFRALNVNGVTNQAPDNLTHFQLGGYGWKIYHRSILKLAEQK